MNLKSGILILGALAAILNLSSMAQEAALDDMLVISNAASPQVAYGISAGHDTLHVVISVEHFKDSAAKSPSIAIQLGLGADHELRLSGNDAVRTSADGREIFTFDLPETKLIASTAGWEWLRMALAVDWAGGPLGLSRQRETFLQSGAHAPFAGLGASENWQPVNLAEIEKTIADRRLQIAVEFEQPMDGKATLVIDDGKGNRVRNLVSGQPANKGKQRIVWEGTNDKGELALPGQYHWRSLSHPGLKPDYQFSFCNGPGSNHGTFHAAATNGHDLFFGTPVSEGGFQLVQLDQSGNLLHGFNAPNGIGLGRVAVAADARFLYAAYDGSGWGAHIDRSKPGWTAEYKVSLLRFDLSSGSVANFGKSAFSEILRYSVGPGSLDQRADQLALSGLALLKGRLYLADGVNNVILQIDPATGAIVRKFAFEKPVAVAANREKLFALTLKSFYEVDPENGSIVKEIAALGGRPSGLAASDDGRFFVSDSETNTARVFDGTGKLLNTVGKLGGIKPGPYDPTQLHNPAGLALAPDGHLWITESERWTPKRLAAFDAHSGQVWKELFGPTAYGASNSGFDPADSSRWFGQGTLFALDFASKSSKPVAILGGEEGRSYRYYRQDGRTFVIACGKATYIEELLPDNTLKPLACLSTAHLFAYAHDWHPPAEFVSAFARDYPAQKYKLGVPGTPTHGFGMLWVDKNGDGKMQADEIEFSTAADSFAGAGWGNDFNGLTLRVPAKLKGKTVMVTLQPDGWWPGGAPKYPSLNDAVKAGTPIDLPNPSAETTLDRFGDMIVNSDPVMRAFAPDGRLLWTYPNRWSNVHGSHNAPLPTAGELQGVLFFTGVAPLDEKSDVLAMNGNHGRAFFMTSDGLYIDEMFPDCRLMTNPQAGGVGILGGECFGGTFGRSQVDGNYYFQGGGIEYRIYRVDGLREAVRGSGTFTVTPAQVVAAERNQVRTVAEKIQPVHATIPYVKAAPPITVKGWTWSADPVAQWNRGNQFPVTVRAAHDDNMLYVTFAVADSSPWVNKGKDWQMLFKTGDGVDIQLGTDPAANSKRSVPVEGDLRLFVAPFQDGNVAVLYRHRLKGAGTAESVVFQSPWRNEKVDSVKKLDSAKIAVTRNGDSYQADIAVPLSELGLEPASFGKALRGDFGVIYGDAEGTTNIFRNYWSNQATGLVNDVPGEVMLAPNLWGDVKLEAAP